MLFNSFGFLIFFVVATLLYYLTNTAWRWLLLLLASCFFYMTFIPVYILVLFGIIIIDYTAAIYMERMQDRKKFLLLLSIIANVAVLAVFKYYNFFVENINSLLGLWHVKFAMLPLWKIILPIGLSFHTFQAMSYTIEVYRGNQRAEKHFGIYALYVMFYPQLVAGPIEGPRQLLHQFYERHAPDFDGIAAGLKTMMLGFFMKVVVADRLAIFVDYVYAHPAVHSRLGLVIAALFYSFQIYGDFAGYSLIAIGAAKVMGFRLSDNFHQPYFASSLAAFWKRWHISLSAWFKKYLYIPLGGNRVNKGHHLFNVLLVFLISGLWHGASYTFIVWGLLHGIFVLIESFVKKRIKKKDTMVSYMPGVVYTFVLVTICWIFFRSPGLHAAFSFISRIISPSTPWLIKEEFEERALLLYSFFGIACIIIADGKTVFFREKQLFLFHKNALVRLVSCITLLVLILMLGVFDGGQFIYFQF